MRNTDYQLADLEADVADALRRIAADPKADVSEAQVARLRLERLIRLTWFGREGMSGTDRRISLTDRGRLTLDNE